MVGGNLLGLEDAFRLAGAHQAFVTGVEACQGNIIINKRWLFRVRIQCHIVSAFAAASKLRMLRKEPRERDTPEGHTRDRRKPVTDPDIGQELQLGGDGALASSLL